MDKYDSERLKNVLKKVRNTKVALIIMAIFFFFTSIIFGIYNEFMGMLACMGGAIIFFIFYISLINSEQSLLLTNDIMEAIKCRQQ